MVDCNDGSDETAPECKKCEEFTCSNGDCILNKWKCNGIDDCVDGSDEKGEYGTSDYYTHFLSCFQNLFST